MVKLIRARQLRRLRRTILLLRFRSLTPTLSNKIYLTLPQISQITGLTQHRVKMEVYHATTGNDKAIRSFSEPDAFLEIDT